MIKKPKDVEIEVGDWILPGSLLSAGIVRSPRRVVRVGTHTVTSIDPRDNTEHRITKRNVEYVTKNEREAKRAFDRSERLRRDIDDMRKAARNDIEAIDSEASV